MSLQADLIADRRKLRRRISLWRVLAVLGALIGVVGAGLALRGQQALPGTAGGPHVARIKISGFISGDDRTIQLINNVRGSGAVQGVVLHVDSPGGSVTGSELLFTALRRLAAEKPTVAVVNGLAASGGYVAAAAADRIIAQQTSLVGSIGVLFQMPNVATLLDRVGVRVETLRSSPLKAAPSGFEPTSPEARAALQQVLDDNYEWFKTLVQERRKLTPQELAAVADGRVHSGRQAVAQKLIDGIGGEPEAVTWLETERGVAKSLPVREWRRRSETDAFGLWTGASRLAAAAGFGGLAGVLARAGQIDPSVRLDGPLALWQPVFESQ
jgi:protease IV